MAKPLDRFKLTIEEKEALVEMSWEPMLKVAGDLVRDIEANVLRYNLEAGPEGLVIDKARAEGAQIVLTRLKEIRRQIQQDLLKQQKK